MRTRTIKNEIELLEQYNRLAHAMEEVSVLKMTDIRDVVLSSREYQDGLIDVFADIRSSNEKEMKVAMQKAYQVKKNKRAIILFSANSRMYGTITDEVFTKCMADVLNTDDDLIIVGKIGKELYETNGYTKPFQYYDLPDYDITFIDLLPILGYVVEYKTVRVYYGRFENMFTQLATVTDITGDSIIETQETTQRQELFITEPSADELYSFYTGQILSIIFKQTAYEFELARHASRIKTLEESLQHAENNKKNQEKLLNRIMKLEQDKKQQSKLSYIWAKKRYEQ